MTEIRQIAEIKIKKQDRFYNDISRIYIAKKCLDDRYWEIISKIDAEYQRYIHEKFVNVRKIYSSDEYPEYYL